MILIFAESAGVSPTANDMKQPVIIRQLGIIFFDGLEPCFAAAASGQQSIWPDAIAITFADWDFAGASIIIAQCGDIAIAALWPIKPKSAPISNAR